jgi:hypothetical protein
MPTKWSIRITAYQVLTTIFGTFPSFGSNRSCTILLWPTSCQFGGPWERWEVTRFRTGLLTPPIVRESVESLAPGLGYVKRQSILFDSWLSRLTVWCSSNFELGMVEYDNGAIEDVDL